MEFEQTIKLKKQPRIIGSYTIVGPKEGQGNFGKYFDYIMKDDSFGEKTYEKAERKMIENAIVGVIEKAKLLPKDIDILLAGDLLHHMLRGPFNFHFWGFMVRAQQWQRVWRWVRFWWMVATLIMWYVALVLTFPLPKDNIAFRLNLAISVRQLHSGP